MDDAAVYLAYSLADRQPVMKYRGMQNAECGMKTGAGGSVLIVVLVVCLGLVSLTLVLGHTMLLAYRGSDNELAGRQADMAIEGAAQYAEAIMSNVEEPGEMPDPENYQAQGVPLGDATFWFIGEPDQTATSNFPTFGLVDEASKLNLNTATLAMLENLAEHDAGSRAGDCRLAYFEFRLPFARDGCARLLYVRGKECSVRERRGTRPGQWRHGPDNALRERHEPEPRPRSE